MDIISTLEHFSQSNSQIGINCFIKSTFQGISFSPQEHFFLIVSINLTCNMFFVKNKINYLAIG